LDSRRLAIVAAPLAAPGFRQSAGSKAKTAAQIDGLPAFPFEVEIGPPAAEFVMGRALSFMIMETCRCPRSGTRSATLVDSVDGRRKTDIIRL